MEMELSGVLDSKHMCVPLHSHQVGFSLRWASPSSTGMSPPGLGYKASWVQSPKERGKQKKFSQQLKGS